MRKFYKRGYMMEWNGGISLLHREELMRAKNHIYKTCKVPTHTILQSNHKLIIMNRLVNCFIPSFRFIH